MHFGSTEIGISVSRQFVLRNEGDGPLVIGNLRSLPSGFVIGPEGFPQPGTSLPEGESFAFSLVLEASSAVSGQYRVNEGEN